MKNFHQKRFGVRRTICSVGCRTVLPVCMRFRPIARQLLDAWCQHAQLTYEKNSDGVVKNTKSTLTTPCTMRSTLCARSSQFNFLYAFHSLSSLIPSEDPGNSSSVAISKTSRFLTVFFGKRHAKKLSAIFTRNKNAHCSPPL